jgi:protein SCO1/2
MPEVIHWYKQRIQPERSPTPMPVKRVYFYLAVSVFVVAIGVGLSVFTERPAGIQVQVKGPTTAVVRPDAPQIGGGFTLTDHQGRTVTDVDYRGKHLLVFFGYTYCPDVCPTNLSSISEALDLLGDDAKQVQPVFVSVDPARDTPEQMKMYVEHFHPSLVGLTGTPAQIKAVSTAYKIYATKTEQDPSDPEAYLMDHTSLTYLMGPDGIYRTFIRHGATPEAIAIKIKDHLAGKVAAN